MSAIKVSLDIITYPTFRNYHRWFKVKRDSYLVSFCRINAFLILTYLRNARMCYQETLKYCVIKKSKLECFFLFYSFFFFNVKFNEVFNRLATCYHTMRLGFWSFVSLSMSFTWQVWKRNKLGQFHLMFIVYSWQYTQQLIISVGLESRQFPVL